MAPKGNTRKRCCSAQMPKAKRMQAAPKPDPVQQKINMVCAALADFSVEVPGSQNCREMMIAVAPCLLKTLKEERNSNQDAVLGMLGEVFETEEIRRQNSIAEATSKMDAADKEWSMLDAACKTAEAELQAKKQDIAMKKEGLAYDVAFVADSVKELQDAQKQTSLLEAEYEMLTNEKEMCLGVQRDSFIVLKDGVLENARDQQRHFGILTQLFKKLSVDKSLWAALPTAMGRQPANRGSFDILVVQQLEESLTRHITSLEEKLANNATLSTRKFSAARAAQTVLEVIREKRQVSSQAFKAAQVEQKQFEVRLSEGWQALMEFERGMLRGANATLWKSMSRLEQAQSVKGALAFLREREAIPEPTVSELVEESGAAATERSREEAKIAEPIATEMITERLLTPEPLAGVEMKLTEMATLEPLQDKVMLDEPVTTDLRIGGM